LAFVCLGYVALDYGGASIFQSYQSWRFDRMIEHQPPSQRSVLMRWIDRALSVVSGQRSVTLQSATLQTPTPHDILPDLAGRSSVPPVPSLPMGALVGRMEIPKLGISVMVLEGDGEGVLQKAVGHVPATAFPGGAGNVVIAGHRDTFFRALRNIHKDDEITFTTTQGIYHYQVGSIDKVGPQDVQVLRALGRPTLTLITCYPFYYVGPAPRRFVVQAWQTQSSQTGESDQILAGARPTLDSHSGVQSPSSTQRKEAHLNSSPSPSDSSPTRTATALTVSTPVMEGTKSTQETTKAQQVDPPAESPSTARTVFGKVRGWLGSIPSRLRGN